MYDGASHWRDPAACVRPSRPTVWPLLAGAVRRAWRRRQSRRALAGLNAFLLRDIGVSYAEAEAEANKPFWVP